VQDEIRELLDPQPVIEEEEINSDFSTEENESDEKKE
jgi:hypothetical protein